MAWNENVALFVENATIKEIAYVINEMWCWQNRNTISGMPGGALRIFKHDRIHIRFLRCGKLLNWLISALRLMPNLQHTILYQDASYNISIHRLLLQTSLRFLSHSFHTAVYTVTVQLRRRLVNKVNDDVIYMCANILLLSFLSDFI